MAAPLQSGAIQVSPEDDYRRLQSIEVGYFNPDAFGAYASEVLNFNPAPSYGRYTELREARYGQQEIRRQGMVVQEAAPPDSPIISAEEANDRAGDLGLNFDGPIPERALEIMMDRKRRENQRQFILSHRRQGAGQVAGDLFFGLALSAVDPLNVASAFIPVVGETRYAALSARLGTTGARLTRGLAEGAVGAALVEPIVYGNARYEQADYGLTDSLMNVVFGTALGGGFHVGFGALGDALGRTRPQTRETSLRAAVSQFVQGRNVDVEPIVRADPAFDDPAHPHYDRIRRESERVQRANTRLQESQAEVGRIDAEIERARTEVDSATTDRAQLVKDRAEGGPALIARHVDEALGQRLGEIEAELAQPTTDRLRRATLERERALLGDTVKEELPRAKGRADAEITALEAIRKREESRIEAANAERARAQEALSRASKAAAKADRRYREALEAGRTPEQLASEGLQWADANKIEMTRRVDRMAQADADHHLGLRRVTDAERAQQEYQQRLADAEKSDLGIEDEIADLDAQIDQLIAEGEMDAALARDRLSPEETAREIDLWTRATKAVATCIGRG